MDALGKKIVHSVFFSATVISVITFIGCTSMKYTINIDPSLQEKHISGATIAVFPVDELSYNPPSSCIPTPTAQLESSKLQHTSYWNQHVKQILTSSFVNNRWVFLTSDAIESAKIDYVAIKEIASRAYPIELINAIKKDVVTYDNLASNQRMQEELLKLKGSTEADYALTFVAPVLTGEIHTSTTYSSTGSSTSSQTYYTADVQVLAWECSTGKLLFASGGWNKSTSYCFFIPPENAAIEGADVKFKKNLQLIIASLLQYDAAKRVALSHQ